MFTLSRDSTLPKLKEDNSQYYPVLVRAPILYTGRKIFHKVMLVMTVLNGSIVPIQKEQFARIYPIVTKGFDDEGSLSICEVQVRIGSDMSVRLVGIISLAV